MILGPLPRGSRALPTTSVTVGGLYCEGFDGRMMPTTRGTIEPGYGARPMHSTCNGSRSSQLSRPFAVYPIAFASATTPVFERLCPVRIGLFQPDAGMM